MENRDQETRLVDVTQENQGPVHIRLPLMPGAIVDGMVRQEVYKLIVKDVQAFVSKWGFRDYNFQMEWPDTNDQSPIILFNAALPSYKAFLSQMLMKIATMSAANKLKFVKELVSVLGLLGMLPQVKMFIDRVLDSQNQEMRGVNDSNENDD